MDVLVVIISIAVVALGMFMLLRSVWQTEFDLRSFKVYPAIICSLLVAGCIYYSFYKALLSLTAYSSQENFKTVIGLFATYNNKYGKYFDPNADRWCFCCNP